MSAAEIVSELQAAGAVIEPRGDRLHIEAPRGLLTPEKREALRRHKRELLAWLARQEKTPRVIVEYRLADSGSWLVMLARPGDSYNDAVASLRWRFGARLVDVRPYRARGAA